MKFKEYLLFLLIIGIALALRLVWLNRIPTGISSDELDYVINAKAVFLTGKDISGTWSPLSLSTPPNEVPKGEIPYLILAPLIGLFDFSLFIARFTNVLLSVALVAIIYLITKTLLGKSQAVIAGLLMAINPWALWFGRTAYDTPLTITFYFFALYVLLIAKGWYILIAFPLLFIAFFSYIGTKVILIPFIVITILYSWFVINRKKFTKQYIILFFLCISILIFFLFSLHYRYSITRTAELRSPNNPNISHTVEMERRLSIQTPLTTILANKFTVFARESFSTYIGAFSPYLLFLYGEYTPFYSLRNQGFFYYLDLPLLLIGIYALLINRRKFVLLIGLILIAPLPAVASNSNLSYGIRSALLFPLLAIIIASGISFILNNRNGNLYKYTLGCFLFGGYSLLLGNFLYNYFFQHPIYGSESFNFSGRVLSKYIELASKKGNKILVISNIQELSNPIFKNYIFYTNELNKKTFKDIAILSRNKSNQYKSLKIANCPDTDPAKDTVIIAPFGSNCKILEGSSKDSIIARLSDGGAIYNIFNDLVCKDYRLNHYPAGITFDDLKIEKHLEKDFCEKFITRP